MDSGENVSIGILMMLRPGLACQSGSQLILSEILSIHFHSGNADLLKAKYMMETASLSKS